MKPHFLLAVVAAVWLIPVRAQDFSRSAVPNNQVAGVVKDVSAWHDRQNPGCRFSKAVGSEVIEKTQEYSEEKWTIKACSEKTFSYRVTVMSTGGGGISDMVSNLD
ncbi:MAG: hypothetical protein JWL98_1333 [Xanthomonadaceae bacterium]|nr:hypothetical protein [Xanthomonadaceae bacterium]